jgi:prepilin-type N-terminal cleavage/methylation domain-containing protein
LLAADLLPSGRRFAAACPPPEAHRAGFTLIELLIVITIIALLASMLMPALQTAQSQGKRISCQNNLKQLVTGVLMYTADNAGKLPENFPGSKSDNSWVLGNMVIEGETTNRTLIRQGRLFPYLGHVDLYRCPADPSKVGGVTRARSYSMNGWVGSRYMESYPSPSGSPYQSKDRTFVRENELAAVGPANIWLMMDEHEASINDAWFLVTMDDSRPFASFPATRHDRAYDLNFADGHLDLYKLRDPESLKFGTTTNAQFSAKNSDWMRLKQVTTAP